MDEVPASSTRVVVSDDEQLSLVAVLKKSKCNWFEFCERIKDQSIVTLSDPLELAHEHDFY